MPGSSRDSPTHASSSTLEPYKRLCPFVWLDTSLEVGGAGDVVFAPKPKAFWKKLRPEPSWSVKGRGRGRSMGCVMST